MQIKISNRMRQLRTERGNTQEELAAIIGVTPQTVSNWERGEGYPDITALPDIASFNCFSVDDLLGVKSFNRKEKVDWYKQEDQRLHEQQNKDARVNLWRKAIHGMPLYRNRKSAYDPHPRRGGSSTLLPLEH